MLIDAPRRRRPSRRRLRAAGLPDARTQAPHRAPPRNSSDRARLNARTVPRARRSSAPSPRSDRAHARAAHPRAAKVSGGRAPQERYYRSQGRGVERQGTRKTTGLTGAQIERLLKADRKQTKASGFSARERYGYTPTVTKHQRDAGPEGAREGQEARLPGTRPEEAQAGGVRGAGRARGVRQLTQVRDQGDSATSPRTSASSRSPPRRSIAHLAVRRSQGRRATSAKATLAEAVRARSTSSPRRRSSPTSSSTRTRSSSSPNGR